MSVMDDLDDLAKRVRGLSPPDRLTLAAELMRAGRSRLALSIAGEVVDNLRLSDVLCNAERGKTGENEKKEKQ